MSTQLQNNGGISSAANRAPAAKVIAGALANSRVAQALIAALGSFSISNAAVAASTSTTDPAFSKAAVGDFIAYVPASAGNVQFGVVATVGTSPFAVVSGGLYLNLTPVNLDANNPIVPVNGQNTARYTGNGGTEF
jgi:hypothetical protein